jgi:glycosyltransferase involved in cell wall biosynthesis
MQARPAQPLTVLMTADAVGGVWNYALSLIAGLPEIRFVLAAMGPEPDAAQRRALARLVSGVLEARPYRLEWMTGADEDLEESRAWLGELVRRHSPDLLHINGYAHARIECDCPVVAVAHSDVLSWWRAVHGSAVPPEWDRYRDEVIAGLRTVDRVVAPTRAVLDDLRRNYSLALQDAAVIPNGIDIETYGPQLKGQVVVSAGRLWDKAKNLTLLDDAADDLPWPIEIAGDVTHPESGIASFSRVRLLGRLNPTELAGRLATAAIYAAPAKYEPFGLGILEAAASGCALVLGDIPSLRETWHDAALFVDPSDPSDLDDTLRHLIGSSWERDRLAAAARHRAGNLTQARMAAQYLSLYRTLVPDVPIGNIRFHEAA